VCWSRSLTAFSRSSSAVGGRRYIISYGRIRSDFLSLGLPQAFGPGRKGAVVNVHGGHEHCMG
jgi:hypothetical protein